MSRRAAALALAGVLSVAACSSRGAGSSKRAAVDAEDGGAQAAPSRTAAGSKGEGEAAPERSSPTVTSAAEGPVAAPERMDPIESDLARASVTALTPRGELSAGVFDASVSIPARATSEAARISIALIDDPYAYRRPLAFYRLARALGAHVVPASVARRIGVGELGALLADQPLLLSFMKARAAIQNDGTIDALITAPGASGGASPWTAMGPLAREVAMNGSAEMETWAGWARSLEPAPSERTPLLRGYIEMLVLDYLSANVIRRSAMLDEATGSLLLTENATAFPVNPDPRALDPILDRLRASARFPRGLRERLTRFDRTAAAAALAPGGFDTWLVSPRSLVTLDERRAGLLTLLEAKVAEAEAAAVADAGPSAEGEAPADRAVLSL